MHRSRIALTALVLFVAACPPPPILNRAMLLDTGEFATTDFDLAQIAGKSHSISFRMMLRYSNSYFNDMIGESGNGSYDIVKTSAGSGQCSAPALAINIGTTFATIQNPHDATHGFQTGVWYTVILTVDSGLRLKAFVDGLAAPVNGGTSVQLASGAWATGTLRFGQRALGNTNPANTPEQFWGLIDAVTVWDHALSASEITATTKAPTTSAKASGVLASWTFDFSAPGALVPVDPHPAQGGTSVPITAADGDAGLFDSHPPAQKTVYALPVKGAWKVVQGSDSACGSHRGYASFCLDLTFHGDDAATQGKPVFAVADGVVVLVRDTSPDDQPNQQVPGCTECTAGDGSCSYEPNEVTLRHTTGESSSYLHLQPHSVPQAVKDALAHGGTIHAGDLVGTAGRSGTGGYHLHFATLWTETLPAVPVTNPSPDAPRTPCGFTQAVPVDRPLVTRPFSFSNFWLRRAGAAAFAKVPLAQLQLNDWICDSQSCADSAPAP